MQYCLLTHTEESGYMNLPNLFHPKLLSLPSFPRASCCFCCTHYQNLLQWEHYSPCVSAPK